jgi:transglycosylase-like protein with SLT domain
MSTVQRRRLGARPAARLGTSLLGVKVAVFVLAVLVGLLVFVGLFITAAGSAVGGGGEDCEVSGKASTTVPANYVPWLAKAVRRYRLDPEGFAIVAAVHSVESDFGRSRLVGIAAGTKNSAGAMGPGQFLEGTWASFGVDADGDGVKDPYGIPDSIFATANYLHASGAPQDWHSALFAYNHSERYVQEVLETAKRFEGAVAVRCQPPAAGEGVQRIESVARWIESRHVHYCWGGGHAAKPGPSGGEYCWSADGRQVFGAGEDGLDCSGAVRWLLVLSGFEDTGPIVSGDFAGAYPSGPGEHLTIWSNAVHVFVTIDGRDWGTSETNFAHGPGFADHGHEGFVASHPEGL